MKRALVTGAAGFIGGRVSELLKESGCAVDERGRGFANDRLSGESFANLSEDVELVVHCAGGSSVGFSVENPLEDFQRTVPPTALLLEQVRRRAPATRVVVVSSGAVYGRAPVIPTPEEHTAAPVSPYGFHKLMSEQLCTSYARGFGLSIAIVRLFSVYGAGLRKQLFWDACHKARAGAPRFAGSGGEIRDWLHVDDAARLILAAGRAASPAPLVINGGVGRGVRVAEALATICRAMGAGEPGFSGERRAGDPEAYVADITRARSLGWEPQVELSAGLLQYVDWFRTHA